MVRMSLGLEATRSRSSCSLRGSASMSRAISVVAPALGDFRRADVGGLGHRDLRVTAPRGLPVEAADVRVAPLLKDAPHFLSRINNFANRECLRAEETGHDGFSFYAAAAISGGAAIGGVGGAGGS